MATSALPLVIDALVALCEDLMPADVDVFDGPGVSDSAAQAAIFIGTDSLEQSDEVTAGSASQAWAQIGQGGDRDQEGVVNCVAQAWSGDTTQKSARDAAYALTQLVEAAVRDDYTLGVPQLLWATYGGDERLDFQQDDAGVRARVYFQVGFRARL